MSDIEHEWKTNPRWRGITRPYKAETVEGLKPSIDIEYSFSKKGAGRFWKQLQEQPFIRAMGALTGGQAVEMARGGLEAIYLSGWQVAGDANESGHTYPDQSFYPCDSVPKLVKRINNAFMRADLVEKTDGNGGDTDWYLPIIADGEAGFGGSLHTFELTKHMIEAGAAAIHLEDQLATEKKCGHLGGKVLIPATQFIHKLVAARLAADVVNVPLIIMARTDAGSARLISQDCDEIDRPFLTGERSPEGYFKTRGGLEAAIVRAKAYAPYVELIWFETSTPDFEEARVFAEEVRKDFPHIKFGYNCSPSFNWAAHLSDDEVAKFQETLAEWGYAFQFITSGGWHIVRYNSFKMARKYRETGMSAFVGLQKSEFSAVSEGYTAVKQQRENGTGYFDAVLECVTGGTASTMALGESTEAEQFS
ncbi:isocitrate lyase [Rhodospirillum sp. A1_3_36]|uniref:isocitrate lyase n=1 Tax=Rhodospirillum sp. A1_3_36 TaxID=3391666 RepID=UPI0039A6AB45